ncbi:MAG: TcpQ domain-containing protein [Enterobacteriaceae bacterium]|nr:TcpQ domain-containing protein [Enterobacteriaceae bacterium]
MHKQAGKQHRLAGIALCLIAAGCADSSRTESISRLQGEPRVQDVYQRSPEVVRYDRYTLASTRPADAQRDPLNQIIEIRMPQQVVKTVGEGLRYLLLESGFSLCNGDSVVFSELFSKPLPAVQRSVGPVRLAEALQVLAGPAWRLHVDDVNREVCFILRDQYRRFTPVQSTVSSVPGAMVPKQPSAAVGGASHNPFSNGSVAPTGVSQPLPAPSIQYLNTPAKADGPNTPVINVPSAKSSGASAHTSPPAGTGTDELFSGKGSQTETAMKTTSLVGNKPVLPAPAVPKVPSVTTKTSAGMLAVKPTTELPPAPSPSAVKSTLKPTPVFSAGEPITVASGPEWRIEPGLTLREGVTKWISKARCTTNAEWVLIWKPVQVDYPIDGPLSFRGSFESSITELFGLYRNAKKPLFVVANPTQCLVVIDDIPASQQGGN